MKNHRKFISSNRRSNLRLLIQMSVFTVAATASLFLWQASAQMQSGDAPSSPQASGDYDPTFNTRLDNGVIFNIEAQPDGKVLIAGNFNSIEGKTRAHVARLNNDGSLDQSFNTGSGSNSGEVRFITLQPDGKIMIGGNFTTFNGFATSKFARLNADGSVDQSFRSTLNSFDLGTGATALTVLANGKSLVSGLFPNCPDECRTVLRLNTDGSRDTTFISDQPFGINIRSATSIIQQPDGKVVAAVYQANYNAGYRSCIARFNSTGALDTAFNPVCDNSGKVTSLLLQPDGKILAVGNFTGINGTPDNRITRLNADGSTDTSFNPGGSGADSTVAFLGINVIKRQADGKLLIAGDFTAYNGVARNRIARLNADGTLDASFNPGTGADNSITNLVLQTDGKILINGRFVYYNGVPTQGIARILNDGAVTPPSGKKATLDFNGDGRTDFVVTRSADAMSQTTWFINNGISTGDFTAVQFGIGKQRFGINPSADAAVPEDYDGDGKTDIAVFRPTGYGDPNRSYFFILRSSDNTIQSIQFGRQGDDPTVSGDYDGDGKADVAVFRKGAALSSADPCGGGAVWYYKPSATPGANYRYVCWGAGGDTDYPAPGDYDGDGKMDFVVYRGVNGKGVFFLNKSGGGFEYVYFGLPTDQINPGDYDGDGKTDFALARYDTVNRNNPIQWYILTRTGGGTGATPIVFGSSNDFTVQGDYDGDGKTDIAVWRPTNGIFYVNRSSDSILQYIRWGQQGDYPVAYYNSH